MVQRASVAGDRDRRAWDAGATLSTQVQLGVEAETRLTDLQSLERRVRLKLRDDPSVDGCIPAVADTRNNRTVLRSNPDAFAGFDRVTQGELVAITSGGNRLVLL